MPQCAPQTCGRAYGKERAKGSQHPQQQYPLTQYFPLFKKCSFVGVCVSVRVCVKVWLLWLLFHSLTLVSVQWVHPLPTFLDSHSHFDCLLFLLSSWIHTLTHAHAHTHAHTTSTTIVFPHAPTTTTTIATANTPAERDKKVRKKQSRS